MNKLMTTDFEDSHSYIGEWEGRLAFVLDGTTVMGDEEQVISMFLAQCDVNLYLSVAKAERERRDNQLKGM